jgi:hypothetical protein
MTALQAVLKSAPRLARITLQMQTGRVWHAVLAILCFGCTIRELPSTDVGIHDLIWSCARGVLTPVCDIGRCWTSRHDSDAAWIVCRALRQVTV